MRQLKKILFQQGFEGGLQFLQRATNPKRNFLVRQVDQPAAWVFVLAC